MPRKNSPPADVARPPSAAAKPPGRSGEGTASLLAQLTDEYRVDEMIRADGPVERDDEPPCAGPSELAP